METLQLNLPTPVLLVWGLPEDAKGFNVIPGNKLYYKASFMGLPNIGAFRDLPEGGWQLIGKLSELTEGDCRELVKETALYKKLNVRPYRFTSYIDGFMGFQFALESFHSAIEAEGYYVKNTYQIERILNPDSEHSIQWQDAQSKTLPANTLIFKRA